MSRKKVEVFRGNNENGFGVTIETEANDAGRLAKCGFFPKGQHPSQGPSLVKLVKFADLKADLVIKVAEKLGIEPEDTKGENIKLLTSKFDNETLDAMANLVTEEA